MTKVKSLEDLKKLKSKLENDLTLREKSDNPDGYVQVKVAMATCGIAAGAKEVMNRFIEKANQEKIDLIVTQTGCMGYCYAEPTAEIKLPGKDPIVFGYLNPKKVDEIIDKYIKNGELIEGIIPVNYQTIDKNDM